MRRLLLLVIALCLPVASVEAANLKVTVYNSNLGVVTDVRSTELEKGENEVSLVDVASRIDPTSVKVMFVGHGEISVIEQNYEYDLVGPDKLLQKYLDRDIDLSAEGGLGYSGKLLGFDSKDLVLGLADGRTAIISQDKAAEIVLPPLETGLVVKPTLFWRVMSALKTSATMEVAYMTDGLDWHAEYTATLGESDNEIRLAAWVSIDNKSGATYPDAAVKLVAGRVHRVQEARVMKGPVPEMQLAAAPQIEEHAFFEYHMYTVPGTTTIKNNEVKQIQFLGETEVKARKQYDFDATRSDKVMVVMNFDNSKDSGLGIPLPAGKVRVYKSDVDGSQEFVGEDLIDHTPRDEEVKLYVGDAFDIVGTRTRTEFNRISDRVTEETIKIELNNHKDTPVNVTVTEHLYGDWDIRRESQPYRKVKADEIEFDVGVQPDSSAAVTYTVRRRT